MRISSYVTFLLPILALLGVGYIIILHFEYIIWQNHLWFNVYDSPRNNLFVLSGIVAVFIFIIFKYVFPKLLKVVNKYILLYCLTAIFTILFIVLTKDFSFGSRFMYELIIFQAITIFIPLIIVYNLFDRRYMAKLHDSQIVYTTLLGQVGEFRLDSITILEQKRNLLSIFREFAFLGFIKRTDITFEDEDCNEYAIKIFPKINIEKNYTFNLIKIAAAKQGNTKIREYTF